MICIYVFCYFRNGRNNGRSTIFSIVVDSDESDDGEGTAMSFDNPDGSMMSMLYPDPKGEELVDHKDGPLENADSDKERELELAQEAFNEVIDAFYRNQEPSKTNTISDENEVKRRNINGLEKEEIIGSAFAALEEEEKLNDKLCTENNDKTVEISANDEIHSTNEHQNNSIEQRVNEDKTNPNMIEDTEIKQTMVLERTVIQKDDYSDVIVDKPSLETTESLSKCQNEHIDESSLCQNNDDNKATIESSITQINSMLDRISNVEELNAARADIRTYLDTILAEYHLLTTKIDYLNISLERTVQNPLSSAMLSNSTPPPPADLQPPPPPPPPPPILTPSKEHAAMPNESLRSMLQKAKVNITPSENSESGVDEIEIRIKKQGKNNMKEDIMSSLQKALRKRQNRESLKDKLKDLK